MTDTRSLNILIGGEAGQGLVTLGHLLSKMLVRRGFRIVVSQDYQSRIRGGHNTFRIRASSSEISAPEERIDLLVALNPETFELHHASLREGGYILASEKHSIDHARCLAVPYKELAGNPRYDNTVALGISCALLGLPKDAAASAVESAFGRKEASVVEANEAALSRAYEWAGARRIDRLGEPEGGAARMMQNGNEAIALGALAAGLKFYAFYPMTPATSIALTLAAHSRRMGVVVEQVEDEIAAINMAIGASYAGAPSMVGTSGGGFALMVEGVSLAAMTETPIVIVVSQRPGPATGLPTRTEQADLELVLHAGHGEFPRAIFAPGTVEQCFSLAHKAMHLAERVQGPIFILTDQYLADSYRSVEPFDLSRLKPVSPGMDPKSAGADYLRHRMMPDGISPRLLPGACERLVVTDSDEHTEDGHITEDLSVRKRMVEKRHAKMGAMMSELVLPTYAGDEAAELLMVCWGSTRGIVDEAAASMRAEGRSVAVMHFSQVWPLDPAQFLGRLQAAKRVAAVEGNSTAQFARLVRRESGFEIKERVLRYDGLPITPDYILKALES
ncbi:MAG: 2-oxoacid:acceptor oxidoreductase subunit alpha [Proteobacteria bacterium]|nr:2-oxoacid:acceptor oxidoreductase subunit alpha [Pseudomonadota bacterium]